MHISHRETHRNDRIGWLRAAILGANDGIVSTASLIVGVAAANAETHAGAMIGGANVVRASWRVTFWGLIAMGSTALVGYLFGVSTA